MNILECKKHIHFIGIGGSGMYPLAQILHKKGYNITGSDNNETETLNAVRKMGIAVTLGQKAENIIGADLIVFTAAIMKDNPELVAAREAEKKGVTLLERSELLGIVTSWYPDAICIAGTHGKTTVTSMLTQIFVTAGHDISAFIGGKLPLIGGSGKVGTSETLICEACEFNDTFLKLHTDTAIILNIDDDHLDYFGTIENSIKSFKKFAEMTTNLVIVNADDENAMKAAVNVRNKVLFGVGKGGGNEYYAENLRLEKGFYRFDIFFKNENLGEIILGILGKHNVYNALAAFAAAHSAGVPFEDIKKGIAEFRGAGRRFEFLGTHRSGAKIYDDYAHHPTEVAAVLNAARETLSPNAKTRIIAVNQPFTFSRTAALLEDFAEALAIADIVVLTDIMGAREKNTLNIFTRNLAEKILEKYPEKEVVFFPQDETSLETTDERKHQNFEDAAKWLNANLKDGDMAITLGCGDAYKIANAIL